MVKLHEEKNTVQAEEEMWAGMTKHLQSPEDCLALLERRGSWNRLHEVVSSRQLSQETMNNFEDRCWIKISEWQKEERKRMTVFPIGYIEPEELDRRYWANRKPARPCDLRRALMSLSLQEKHGSDEVCRMAAQTLCELLREQIAKG